KDLAPDPSKKLASSCTCWSRASRFAGNRTSCSDPRKKRFSFAMPRGQRLGRSMASNAFDEIDQVVYDALRLSADVLACISAERILLSDRPVDIRDEPRDATKMGARLWVLPLRSGIRLE